MRYDSAQQRVIVAAKTLRHVQKNFPGEYPGERGYQRAQNACLLELDDALKELETYGASSIAELAFDADAELAQLLEKWA
jgi:hypothetical protein